MPSFHSIPLHSQVPAVPQQQRHAGGPVLRRAGEPRPLPAPGCRRHGLEELMMMIYMCTSSFFFVVQENHGHFPALAVAAAAVRRRPRLSQERP